MKALVIKTGYTTTNKLKHLLAKKFIFDEAASLQDAEYLIQKVEYDIVFMCSTSGAIAGLKTCELIRKYTLHLPILVLCRSCIVSDVVGLINAGADDIIKQPFSEAELKARITALLRRQTYSYKPNVLAVADLKIDINSLQVHRSGVKIRLRRKELEILIYLVQHKGRPVSRTMILSHAWEVDRDNWHNTVDVHIKHLRDKIDRPFEQSLIKTAYGFGYMIEDN